MQFLGSLYNAVFYQPIFNALILLYNFIPGRDLGIAIILLTILFRIMTLPLSIKAALTQKKFTELQPKVKEIQEKFKASKDQQARALLELYQKEKVNPFAGIFPLLVQIPVLFALFQVFGKGLQTEHISNLYWFVENPGVLNAHFLQFLDLERSSLWVGIIAGVFQFIQGKQMVSRPVAAGATGGRQKDFASTMQTSMTYFFPFITVYFVSYFPSAVGLYWITTSIFSIWQQWHINRKFTRSSDRVPDRMTGQIPNSKTP